MQLVPLHSGVEYTVVRPGSLTDGPRPPGSVVGRYNPVDPFESS
jgi:hypothetical protein